MFASVNEVKLNFEKYLLLSELQDIFITKNGSVISKLSKPTVDKKAILDSLVGIVPSKFSDIDIKEERLSRQ